MRPEDVRLMAIDSSFKQTSNKIEVMCDKVIDVISGLENCVISLDRSTTALNNRNYNLTYQFVSQLKQMVSCAYN